MRAEYPSARAIESSRPRPRGPEGSKRPRSPRANQAGAATAGAVISAESTERPQNLNLATTPPSATPITSDPNATITATVTLFQRLVQIKGSSAASARGNTENRVRDSGAGPMSRTAAGKSVRTGARRTSPSTEVVARPIARFNIPQPVEKFLAKPSSPCHPSKRSVLLASCQGRASARTAGAKHESLSPSRVRRSGCVSPRGTPLADARPRTSACQDQGGVAELPGSVDREGRLQSQAAAAADSPLRRRGRGGRDRRGGHPVQARRARRCQLHAGLGWGTAR